MILNIIIEIPKGTNNKYEMDKESGCLVLDRVLASAFVYPQNYGFIPDTLDMDGDPLDVFLISNSPIFPLTNVTARIMGGIAMIDGGDRDTKILAVIDGDPRFEHIRELEDMPIFLIDELVDFLKNYKNLEDKSVEIEGILNLEETLGIIEEGVEMYKSKALKS